MIVFKDISKMSKYGYQAQRKLKSTYVKKFSGEKLWRIWGVFRVLTKICVACRYREFWWALTSTLFYEHISDVRLLVNRCSNVYPILHYTAPRKLCGTPWRSLRTHTFPSLCQGCLTQLIWPSVRGIPQPHRKWKQSLRPLPGNLTCELW